MAIQLPDLNHSMVNRIGVCSGFPKSLFRMREVPRNHVYKDARYGHDCYIQSIVGRFADGDIHYHINLASSSYFDGDTPNTNSNLEDVLDSMQPFLNQSAEFTLLRANFALPARKLPPSGLVKGLSGMSTTVAGEQLELIGAKFSISGSQFDRLEWEWKKNKDKTLAGKFAAIQRQPAIEDDFLLAALSTVEHGIKQFFLKGGV
jgi:hypothetical protein